MPRQEPIDLSKAGGGNFKRTRSRLVEALWIIVEFVLVSKSLQVSSGVRAWALRMVEARIGANVLLRPRLRVTFPWNLRVGDNCWFGEGVWIHNRGLVTIEDNAIVSQEAFISADSHDIYSTMDLIVEPVTIRRGVWITSWCIVLQGVEVGENTVVTPGSVVQKSLAAEGIYGGNPATFVRQRWKVQA